MPAMISSKLRRRARPAPTPPLPPPVAGNVIASWSWEYLCRAVGSVGDDLHDPVAKARRPFGERLVDRGRRLLERRNVDVPDDRHAGRLELGNEALLAFERQARQLLARPEAL